MGGAPHDVEISGYAQPSDAEKAARKKRNYAIAGALVLWTVGVFLTMLYKMGVL